MLMCRLGPGIDRVDASSRGPSTSQRGDQEWHTVRERKHSSGRCEKKARSNEKYSRWHVVVAVCGHERGLNDPRAGRRSGYVNPGS